MFVTEKWMFSVMGQRRRAEMGLDLASPMPQLPAFAEAPSAARTYAERSLTANTRRVYARLCGVCQLVQSSRGHTAAGRAPNNRGLPR